MSQAIEQDCVTPGHIERIQNVPREAWNFVNGMSIADRELHFGRTDREWSEELDMGKAICKLLLEWRRREPYQEVFERSFSGDNVASVPVPTTVITHGAGTLLDMEKRAQAVFRAYKDTFPTSIWTCCTRFCFTSIAIDPEKLFLFEELRLIHEVAERQHAQIQWLPNLVETRRRGVGGSFVGFVAPSRREREIDTMVFETDRRRRLRNFGILVLKVLPFLYGKEDASSGTKCPTEKLCTEAICSLLGISRKFLYGRKKLSSKEHSMSSTEPSDQELWSLIDIAGTRMRQHRRVGDRNGYPPIEDLPTYDCSCSEPCLSSLNVVFLTNEYNAFSRCARELNPRRRENRYLLNVMFVPLSNAPTKVCDSALSALYTVSKGHVSDVRAALTAMCNDPEAEHHAFIEGGVDGYRKHSKHPMNRYPNAIREKVENHLDMILRADPAGANGLNLCRVYSPEINTKEKLREILGRALGDDEDVDGQLSQSTLQRMVETYLQARNCTIEFNQSDHNACPNCKTLNYAILQFHYEAKQLEQKYNAEFGVLQRPFREDVQRNSDHFLSQLETKRYQENEALREFVEHNQRDAAIRQTVKSWSDYFRGIENHYRELRLSGNGWCSMRNHAILTHQDDMTKVDLPHFVVNASADITRWRFDVNAHVSAVTKEAVVFSHEQGAGAKNASAILEMILLDHIVRCKGESIKIIVSDNAAVGKNWLVTIALPQYIVDQGLADIAMVVFLENNHGKWLADMLFGQWQTRRRRSTLLSIDDLLSEFEAVNCKGGSKVHGFAVNPLCSVDFASVFESLGYETKPPKDFGFAKRNIHFATACRQEAKQQLSNDVLRLLGSALPEADGMVRISASPPTHQNQLELPYDERYFDVPAARLSAASSVRPQFAATSGNTHETPATPLVVPLDNAFSPGGRGVVSQRTAQHVGFNGIEFRNSNGYPELRNSSSSLVQRALPSGLIQPYSISDTGEPVYGVESVRCAPENWVVRRPVRHYGNDLEWKARYPPRNMLNAKFGRGPRSSNQWVPTSTYEEPPFPVIEGNAAYEAMKAIAAQRTDISKSLNVLDLLREIYQCMGDRDGVSNLWLQRRATVPSRESVLCYRNRLRSFNERWDGEPSAPRTLRQMVKLDEDVGKRVTRILQERGQNPSNKTCRNAVYSQLFDEISRTPGGLDRYLHLVEKDHERYSSELKSFKEKIKQFDRDHGLLPREV